MWISESDGTVLRIDPKLSGIKASIPACRNALAVAYGEGAVWAACGNGTVVRIDPAADRPSAIVWSAGFRAGSQPARARSG